MKHCPHLRAVERPGDRKLAPVGAVVGIRVDLHQAKEESRRWQVKCIRLETLFGELASRWPRSQREILDGIGLDRMDDLTDVEFGVLLGRLRMFLENDK